MQQKNLKLTFITIALVVFLLLGFLFMHATKIAARKIVIFDLKKTYATFLHQAASLPKAKADILTKRFPQAVTAAVDTYAKKNHAIVFVKGAVINGAKDVTTVVQTLIAREMKKNA